MTVEDYSAVLELRKLHSSSLDKSVNLATVRMAWMKRGQPGRGGRTKCFFIISIFFTCPITCTEIATPFGGK